MARLAWGKTLVAAIRQLFNGKSRTRHLRGSQLNKKRALMLSKKQLQLQMPSWSRWQKWNGSRLIRVAVSNTSTIRRYRPLRVSICQNGAFRTRWRKIKTFSTRPWLPLSKTSKTPLVYKDKTNNNTPLLLRATPQKKHTRRKVLGSLLSSPRSVT